MHMYNTYVLYIRTISYFLLKHTINIVCVYIIIYLTILYVTIVCATCEGDIFIIITPFVITLLFRMKKKIKKSLAEITIRSFRPQWVVSDCVAQR